MTDSQKRLLEDTIETEIIASRTGIDTRIMAANVLNVLSKTIPDLNMHHIYGMFSWVYKSYHHTFIKKTPGSSIVI